MRGEAASGDNFFLPVSEWRDHGERLLSDSLLIFRYDKERGRRGREGEEREKEGERAIRRVRDSIGVGGCKLKVVLKVALNFPESEKHSHNGLMIVDIMTLDCVICLSSTEWQSQVVITYSN